MNIDRLVLKLNGKKVYGIGNWKICNEPTGRWRIDNEMGKMMCVLEIEVSADGTPPLVLRFTPTHFFCETFMDMMLEAEHYNDTYEFKAPSLNSRRPPQLKSKLGHLRNILLKWKAKADEIERPRLL